MSALLGLGAAFAGVGNDSLEYPRTLDLRRTPYPRRHPGPRTS